MRKKGSGVGKENGAWFIGLKHRDWKTLTPQTNMAPSLFCGRLVDDHQEKRFQLASLLPVQRGGPILTFCVLFVFT